MENKNMMTVRTVENAKAAKLASIVRCNIWTHTMVFVIFSCTHL